MTFGKEWGWGLRAGRSQAHPRRVHRPGRQLHRHRQRLHQGALRGDHRRAPGARPQESATAVVIATKFTTNMFLGDPNGGGSNRRVDHRPVRRIATAACAPDYIDLYWLHAWDRTTPIEETMRALDTLVEQGKVRYLGFSDTPAWKMAQAQTMALLKGWSPLIALTDRILAPPAHGERRSWCPWRRSSASASPRGARSAAAP